MASVHLRVYHFHFHFHFLVLLLGNGLLESLAQEGGEGKLSTGLIDPSRVIQLSWHPRVFLYRGFLSAEECDQLISWGLHKSNVDGDDSSSNNTESKWIDVNNEISRRVEEKISAWSFLPQDNKGLQLFHIGVENSSGEYSYFDTKHVSQGGKSLLATVILYLSDVSHGGHITFPQSEKKIWPDCKEKNDITHPTKGNAIIFFNRNLNATLDQTSSHGRCPVLEGEMWYATKFLYVKQVKEEKITTQSNEGDCTDEDENCVSWAAAGECGKNPVFMIGSPDYYGTCRKSCNACSM